MAEEENAILTALTLKRHLPTNLIPIDQLSIDPEIGAEDDPIFLKQYVAFLTGKLTAYMTRVSLPRILRGFYLYKKPHGFQYCCDKPPSDHVEFLAALIQRGDRPALHLYRNVNPSDNHDFVAPDDVATHLAYERLGISKVPVVILSSQNKGLEESAIGFRYYGEKKAKAAYLHSHQPFCPKVVPAFFTEVKPAEFLKNVEQLARSVRLAMIKVKEFHRIGKDPLHYHHTLYSTLFRIEETLEAMSLLVQKDMWYQAAPLMRTLYESSLNFYLDWLAPGQMAPFFALSAVASDARIKKFLDNDYDNRRAEGESAGAALAAREGMKRGLEIVRNIRLKAEMSPLGDTFYSNMYGFLSNVAHQDFQVVAAYANTFHVDKRPYFEEAMIRRMLRWIDLIVAKVVTRVLDDVGQAQSA